MPLQRKLVLTVLGAHEVPEGWPGAMTHKLGGIDHRNVAAEQIDEGARIVSHSLQPLEGGLWLLSMITETDG